MRRILCFDDDITRYARFYKLALAQGILLQVTCDPDYVMLVLSTKSDSSPLIGICQDHDMPGVDTLKIVESHICPYNYPVAIVSSNPVGAKNIQDLLGAYCVRNKYIPTMRDKWEDQVLSFFNMG
jgi:hypothetical protein